MHKTGKQPTIKLTTMFNQHLVRRIFNISTRGNAELSITVGAYPDFC